MEDVGKALLMASQVLLFALACSVSIVLYSAIRNNVDKVTLYHDYSNRGDAIVASDEQQKEREVMPAEVILAVLDLKNKNNGDTVTIQTSKNGTRTYKYDELNDSIKTVGAGGSSFQFGSEALYNELIQIKSRNHGSYKLTYSENELYYKFYNN